MSQQKPPKPKKPGTVSAGLRLVLKAVGGSEKGATALGYALAFAAATMITTGTIIQFAKPQAAVTRDDMGARP